MGESDAEEVIDSAVECCFDFGSEVQFKFLFNCIVFAEQVSHVVNIQTEDERWFTLNKVSNEDARCIGTLFKPKFFQDGCTFFTPVSRTSLQPIQGFLQSQVGLRWGDGTTWRWATYIFFVGGEIRLAECLADIRTL